MPKKSIDGGDIDDNYDPHLHRVVPHPTSNSETLAHLLKGCLGTGILAMHQVGLLSEFKFVTLFLIIQFIF